MEASASEYLEHYHQPVTINFDEFIQCYKIQNKHEIEKLIIYAISYNKFTILDALFNPNTGYFDPLYDTFRMGINSLYSVDCLSLVPTIKIVNKTSEDSSLFSQNIIESSNLIEFDHQIQVPQTSVVSQSIFQHLLFTNEHLKNDMKCLFVSEVNTSLIINIKPHYMSYFDHCMLLGHYTIGLKVLELLGGWETFVNGNCMIYLREMMVKQCDTSSNNTKVAPYNSVYINIVRDLYSMGADVDNIYHNHILKGFAYLYDIITDSNAIFETRQIALTNIMKRFTHLNFDLCFMFVSFVPYINATMIQKMPHQQGMVLTQK